MKHFVTIIFLLGTFSLSYSQRKKPDLQARSVIADVQVSAPVGNFKKITGIDSTEIDNANGTGDSTVLYTTKGLRFKKFREGSNVRFDHEGDSVIIINPIDNAATQVFMPKYGEASSSQRGFTPVSQGTVTARVPTSTSLLSSSGRVGYVGGATAGSLIYLTATANTLWRGSGAGLGGFYELLRFGIPQNVSNSQMFYGLWNTAISSSVDPSTQLNILGVGKDAADATLQIMVNDASGVATKVNTGLAISATTIYEATISALPFSSSVFISIKDLSSGNSFSTSTTTNIPLPTQFLKLGMYMSNNTTATAIGYDILKIYTESKY